MALYLLIGHYPWPQILLGSFISIGKATTSLVYKFFISELRCAKKNRCSVIAVMVIDCCFLCWLVAIGYVLLRQPYQNNPPYNNRHLCVKDIPINPPSSPKVIPTWPLFFVISHLNSFALTAHTTAQMLKYFIIYWSKLVYEVTVTERILCPRSTAVVGVLWRLAPRVRHATVDSSLMVTRSG